MKMEEGRMEDGDVARDGSLLIFNWHCRTAEMDRSRLKDGNGYFGSVCGHREDSMILA